MALEHVGSSTRRKAARKALTAAELEALASGGAGMARFAVKYLTHFLLSRTPSTTFGTVDALSACNLEN